MLGFCDNLEGLVSASPEPITFSGIKEKQGEYTVRLLLPFELAIEKADDFEGWAGYLEAMFGDYIESLAN